MFSVSAVLIALLLIPTFSCIFVLHVLFPKNTLKLNESFVIPLGLGLTLIANCRQIFRFIEILNPVCCFGDLDFEHQLSWNVLNHKYEIVLGYMCFWFMPVTIFLVGLLLVRRCWKLIVLDPSKTGIVSWIGNWADRTLVNYMGRMTAHLPSEVILCVDVLDTNGQVFSGVFLDYSMEDKKLIGLELSNVIRKEQKHIGSDDDIPYVLPRSGTMYFPIEKIQNFHFWEIPTNSAEEIHIKSPANQTRFAWLLGLQHQLRYTDLKVTGFFEEDDQSITIRHLLTAAKATGLTNQQVADAITKWPKYLTEKVNQKAKENESASKDSSTM